MKCASVAFALRHSAKPYCMTSFAPSSVKQQQLYMTACPARSHNNRPIHHAPGGWVGRRRTQALPAFPRAGNRFWGGSGTSVLPMQAQHLARGVGTSSGLHAATPPSWQQQKQQQQQHRFTTDASSRPPTASAFPGLELPLIGHTPRPPSCPLEGETGEGEGARQGP